jgi:penicillin amidase
VIFGRLVRLVVALLLVAVVLVAGLVAAITWRSLPQTSGTLHISALETKVTVIRDKYGIVNIYADSPHDLFLAQGYVHAQERMWQMEVWRHVSAGRLSELFGESGLETDRFVRTLNFRGAAERDLAALSPNARAILDAYADGINAWLDVHRDSLGLPFVVTAMRSGRGGIGGYDMERWTALDSLAWQKVEAWDLGGNLDTEIFRMLADARLESTARTDQLFAPYPADAPVIDTASATGRLVRGNGATTATADTAVAAISPAETDRWRAVARVASALAGGVGGDERPLVGDGGIGSNGWVVGAKRSASGGALLANDPHLGIGMPSVWFINGLHCRKPSAACPYNVSGVSFPGVPAVVLGHNARIAWGATNVNPDVQDLFVEQIDPNNDANYLFRGRSVPLTIRREEIKVAGSKTQTLTVRETAHGPLLNAVDVRLKTARPMALRWSATAVVDGTFDAILGLNLAGSFEDFRNALRDYGAPAQNFVYADVDGHIGYQLPGWIPVRDGGARGDRPVRGDDGNHEWTGRIPFRELPWALDPAAGTIVTANNRPAGAGYDHYLGDEWDPGYRASAIVDGLAKRKADGITQADLRAIQLDTTIGRAARVVPKLSGVAPSTQDGRRVLDAIRKWDRTCPVDSTGCAAYMAFEFRLIGGIFDDELGPMARDYVGSTMSWQTTIALLEAPDAGRWDDTRTNDVRETSRDIVARALDRAGGELRGAFGAPDKWRWGALHQASFREETLGSSGIGPLEMYLDRGPVEVPGAAGAVLNTYYDLGRAYSNPADPDFEPLGIGQVFGVTVMPSYRLTIDMSDVDAARIVQSTGQAGNPFDAHYGDMIEPWRTGQSVPLPFSSKAVEQAAASTVTFAP